MGGISVTIKSGGIASGNMPRLEYLDGEPALTVNGAYDIVFDGEIYNFSEVYRQISSGNNYGTVPELVASAYEKWGAKCLNYFDGIWVLAIFDRRAGKLFAASDRFGTKPLYYAVRGGKLMFASNIRALLDSMNLPRKANLPLVYDFLTQGLLDHTDKTMFEGVYSLPAGCYAEFDKGIEVFPKRYYDIAFSDEIGQSLTKEQKNEFNELFTNSVKARLGGDEVFGSFLSGGLDSSAVVCALKNIKGAGFKVFSSVPADKRVDESVYINAVLEYTGVSQVKRVPESIGFMKELMHITLSQEQPVGSAAMYASYDVMRSAKESGINVLFDGQGSDEIMCGYRKSRVYYIKKLLRTGKGIKAAKELVLSATQIKTSMNLKRDADKLLRIMGGGREKSVFARYLGERLVNTSGYDYDRTLNFRHNDVFVNSLPVLLRCGNSAAIAAGVGIRMPFLDHKLVEFCAKLPLTAILENGWSKAPLRYGADLPEKIRRRKTKIGFGVPEDTWIRENAGYFKSLFTNDCRCAGLVDINKFLGDFDAAVNGKIDIGLWRYISLELWMRALDVE